MNIGQVLALFGTASAGLAKKGISPEYTITNVNIGGTSYKTYWPIAPTSSNKVYGISFDPSNGELIRIFNNNGAYSRQEYAV